MLCIVFYFNVFFLFPVNFVIFSLRATILLNLNLNLTAAWTWVQWYPECYNSQEERDSVQLWQCLVLSQPDRQHNIAQTEAHND